MEFAVDNVQTLKLRKAKLQSQQQAAHDGNDRPNDGLHMPDVHSHKKERKRKSRNHGISENDSVLNTEVEEAEFTAAINNAPERHKSKKQKANRKSRQPEELAVKEKSGVLSMRAKDEQDSQNHGGGKSAKGQDAAIDANETKAGKKADHAVKKREMQNQKDYEGEKISRKRSKKNKVPVGKDVVDKLDKLIEQYRSKFSQQGSQGNDTDKKSTRELRKWFQL